MGDMIVQAFWCCESVLGDQKEIPSSRGGTHTVRYEMTTDGMMTWICPCESYTYRGHCKHATDAEGEHCGWDQFLHGGNVLEVDQHNVCPRCGGPVTAQNYAV